jgi:transposase
MYRYHKEEPAHSVVQYLGTNKAVAEYLGCSASTITKWQMKKSGQGRIPTKHWGALIKLAKRQGKHLNAEQLAGFAKINDETKN